MKKVLLFCLVAVAVMVMGALVGVYQAGKYGQKQAVIEPSGRKANEMLVSWYGSNFHGRKTASGEIFDQNGYTAAHKTLPLGTYLFLTNPENRQWVTVRINDRGPYWEDRELDVSKAAADVLGMKEVGVTTLNFYIFPETEKEPEVIYRDGNLLVMEPQLTQ